MATQTMRVGLVLQAFNHMGNALGQANNQVRSLGSTIQATSQQIQRVGNKNPFAKLGSDAVQTAKVVQEALGGIAADYAGKAVLGELGNLAKKAGDVQMQLIRMSGTYGLNIDDSQIKDIDKHVRELSQQTLFSQSETMKIGVELVGAGIAKESLKKVLDEATYLAEVEVGMGKSSSGERTAYNFSRMAEDAGITGDVPRMQGFADQLNRVISVTHASTESLGESFKYAMPTVKTLGWSEIDVLNASALAARSGIEGSMAGTHIKDFAQRINPYLYVGTKGGQKQLEAMADVGLISDLKKETPKKGKAKIIGFGQSELTNGNKGIKSYMEIMDALVKKHDAFVKSDKKGQKHGELEWVAKMHHIFGEQGQDIAAITSHREVFNKLKEQMEVQKDLHTQIETIRTSFVGQMHVAKGQVESIGLQIGKPIMEFLTPALKVGTEHLAKLIQYLDEHPKLTQFFAITAGGAASMLVLGGGIATVVSGIRLLQQGMATAGLPVGSLIRLGGGATLAIAGVAAAGALIYQHWDDIGPYAKAVWETVKDSAQDALDTMESIGEGIGSVWETIKTSSSDGWGIIKEAMNPHARDTVNNIIAEFDRFKNYIKETNQKDIEKFFGFHRESDIIFDPLSKQTKAVDKTSWHPTTGMKAVGGIATLFALPLLAKVGKALGKGAFAMIKAPFSLAKSAVMMPVNVGKKIGGRGKAGIQRVGRFRQARRDGQGLREAWRTSKVRAIPIAQNGRSTDIRQSLSKMIVNAGRVYVNGKIIGGSDRNQNGRNLNRLNSRGGTRRIINPQQNSSGRIDTQSGRSRGVLGKMKNVLSGGGRLLKGAGILGTAAGIGLGSIGIFQNAQQKGWKNTISTSGGYMAGTAFGGAMGALAGPVGSMIGMGVGGKLGQWADSSGMTKKAVDGASGLWNKFKGLFSGSDTKKSKLESLFSASDAKKVETNMTKLGSHSLKTSEIISKNLLEVQKEYTKMGSVAGQAATDTKTQLQSISTVTNEAHVWGENAVTMMAEGMRSQYPTLTNASKGAATIISNYMGHHSPTKYGPGSDSDKWAPNLMGMLASGILASSPQVEQSAKHVATRMKKAFKSSTLAPSRSVIPLVTRPKPTGQHITGGQQQIIHDTRKFEMHVYPKNEKEAERGVRNAIQLEPKYIASRGRRKEAWEVSN